MLRRPMGRSLAADGGRFLVFAQPFKSRLAQQIVLRPFGEGDLCDDLWANVMHLLAARNVLWIRERRRWRFKLFQPAAKAQQNFICKARPDLSGIAKGAV